MNWTKDRSILLSLFCVYFFAGVLLVTDISAYWLVRWFAGLRGMLPKQMIGVLVTVYACSIFAWITLYQLRHLLYNLRVNEVFTTVNIRALRIVSWCCAGVAGMCLVSMLWYIPFVFVAMAAAFMCLIVRIVKNVFQQATAMKDELDLTI